MSSTIVTEDDARFMQGGVSISVASRDRRFVPSLARSAGCRLSADRQQVTVLVLRSQARQLLQDITDTGAIAVVFSEPSTHRTIQLKGLDASVHEALPADTSVADEHRAAFASDIVPLGYVRELAYAIHGFTLDDMQAITFTPTDIFQQTPGPGAGVRMGR
ncbi:MAG TPA: hypothetical protein DF427_07175 [Moraxellaceae bacterium]|nr:hypothetical protein [Moraxellaceae bacterium]